MAVSDYPKTLDDGSMFEHPLYQVLHHTPGLSIATAKLDELLTWGVSHALWMFPMATSCCGIEFMAAAGARVDVDRMGTIVRASPRHADVMVVAGTITVKMAPRVRKLWDQMPEPKWCIAMGSCAISGDFYRNLYSVVPGIDTFLPVDVYVPGCPPNPESLMHGLMRLQEKVKATREGKTVTREQNPGLLQATNPSIPRLDDKGRNPALSAQQESSAADVTMQDQSEPLVIEPAAPTQAAASSAAASDFETLLKTEFGVTELPKNGPPLVPAARHLELATRLKAMGYTIYGAVVASHWLSGVSRTGKTPGEPEHYEVATVLRSVGKGSKTVTWAVKLGVGEPLQSLAGLFAGADWQEREQYDLVGVRFAGHPDLRRLMMPENYTVHPLRRDLPADLPYAPWR